MAVVLGSGLGGFADSLDDARRVTIDELPGFATPTVPGHAGAVVAGRIDGRSVLVLAGRVHLYEGHSTSTRCATACAWQPRPGSAPRC